MACIIHSECRLSIRWHKRVDGFPIANCSFLFKKCGCDPLKCMQFFTHQRVRMIWSTTKVARPYEPAAFRVSPEKKPEGLPPCPPTSARYLVMLFRRILLQINNFYGQFGNIRFLWWLDRVLTSLEQTTIYWKVATWSHLYQEERGR